MALDLQDLSVWLWRQDNTWTTWIQDKRINRLSAHTRGSEKSRNRRPMKDKMQGPEEREGDCMVMRYWLGTQSLQMRETILRSWNFILRCLGNHWILLKYDRDMIRTAFSEGNWLERGRTGCRKVLPGDTELRFPYCTEDLSHFLVLLHAPTKLNTLF